MIYSELQVAVDVLIEELNTNVYLTCNISDTKFPQNNNWIIPEELLINVCDPEEFKQGIQLILKQNPTNEWTKVGKIIFKTLVVIYVNSKQEERFWFLSKLLQYFYDKLVQKLIKMHQHSSIICLEDYLRIVRKMLPTVKLEVLKKLLSSNSVNFADLQEAIGEVNECIIHPKILREDCYQIIRNKLKKQEVVFLGFTLAQSNEKNGVASDYYNLSIHVKDQNQVCTHKFFIKYIPENVEESFREFSMGFEKEYIFYEVLIPMIEKLGFSDATDFAPRCLFSCKNLFLVLEDLSAEGFRSLNIENGLTYEHLSVIFKELSKVHGCTVLFERKLSRLLGYEVSISNYFPKMISENTISKDRKTVLITECSLSVNTYLVQQYFKLLNKQNVNVIMNKVEILMQSVYDVVKPSIKQTNVLNHGDLWNNNIFFSEDFSQCKLLDFGSTRWCPPACDFLMLLMLNTDKTTRENYGSKLIDQYYDIAKYLLSRHKIGLNFVIPRQEHLDFFAENSAVISSIALAYLQDKLLPGDIDQIAVDVDLQHYSVNPESKIKVLDKIWKQMKALHRMEELIYDIIDMLIKDT